MPDQTLQVAIEVVSEGVDKIQQVDKELSNMTKTTDSTTKSLGKQDDLMRMWNTSLNKQIPAMQVLNPLLNVFNLGMLASVGVVGLAGAGIGMLAQSAISMGKNISVLGATLNQNTIGPMFSYNDIMTKIHDETLKTTVTMAQLTAGLLAMNPKITDQATQWQILIMAEEVYKATGISVADAVKLLSGALTGDTVVRDKNTGAILLGVDALRQEFLNLMSQKNAWGMVLSVIKDYIGNLIHGQVVELAWNSAKTYNSSCDRTFRCLAKLY